MVEGYTDCIACWEAGIKNVVATLGTALTEHHVKTLTRFAKRIVYMFDGDAAGQKAARRAIQFIEQDSMDLRCVVLPDGNDPMEFITAHGGEALQARIDAAEPLMDFVYRSLQESSDITTPGGRAKALEDALTLIYPLRDSYMIDTYFIQIADLLGLDLETVRSSSGRVFSRCCQARGRRASSRAELRAPAGAGRACRQRGRSGVWFARDVSRCLGVGGDASGVHTGRGRTVRLCAARGLWGRAGRGRRRCAADRCAGWHGWRGAGCRCNGRVCGSDDADRADRPGAKVFGGGARAADDAHELPDLFRTYADRICSIEWVDPRHESIAWAVLATPPGTDPTACMDAARAVCPEAASLVSAGRISSTSKHPTETNIVFMLDTLELYTIKRRMRAAQAKLRQDRSLDDEARRVLTMQAMQDSQRQRELQKSIGGVADPFRLIGLETADADQA